MARRSGEGAVPEAPIDGSTYGRQDAEWTVVGGGTAVTSAFARTGDVVAVSGDYTATQVSSAGPSTVQADLDALAALTPITSAAMLEAMWPAVGGVHTITDGGEFQLLPGETVIDISPNQIEFVYPGALFSRAAKVAIRSSVDGPVIFGEASISNMQIESVGVGVNAKCVAIESLAGRQIDIDNVTLVGQDPGIFENILGPLIQRFLTLIPVAPGAKALRYDGTIGGVLNDSTLASVTGAVPYIGIQVLATCSIGFAFVVDRFLLRSLNVGDAGIDISTSATVSPTFIFSSTGCLLEGPGSLFLAGSVDAADPKMISTGQRNAPNSLWLGDASFVDTVTPIILTHTGGWDVVPFENVGATSVLTENVLNQRFTLNRDLLQDWQMVGAGRTDSLQGPMSWSADVARSGGGAVRPFAGRLEWRPDNVSLWAAVPESEASDEMGGATPTTIFGSAPAFAFDKTAEFRLVAQGNNTTATAISRFRITTRAI